ncbi:FAD-dependent oxidoreductase [Amnibacterium setariae]|uniref:FAD-dependent monooxygenase n=1 Tax=Amnibacterium setariae TaxID=2306585 RepID=A0A3A1U2D7_9MICO|nr:NAD(P)/FAD-dependent oxidoreductase [Amnibacterium setariae]RIX31095.1 FAD-dependent monooxygenase [Amnibacterium setariae]
MRRAGIAEHQGVVMRIVVVGAGLVGLTTAAVFQRAGHEVVVVERAPEIRAVGAGIGLWQNALQVFDHLGIGGEIRSMSHEVDTWFYTPAGEAKRAPGTAAQDYRFLLVPRPELNAMLAGLVGDDWIRTDDAFERFGEHDGGVTVSLSSGATIEAALLIGADGVYSRVRTQLLPGTQAERHGSHTAWRAIVPSRLDERRGGTSLTIGTDGTRGGYTRLDDHRTMWMVNQFDTGELVGGKRDRALARARHLASPEWQPELLEMIADTPDEAILENPIMLVPPLGTWSSRHVTLIGDAAHGLSPHLSAGGTLGIEDVIVLHAALAETPFHLASALHAYESARIPRFAAVRDFASDIEHASTAEAFAAAYARFSHWMVTTAPVI